MFQVGDTVLYGAEGVCEIVEIAERKFDTEKRLYYVLKPVRRRDFTCYLPTDSSAVKKLRKVLSAEEIRELIRTTPDSAVWIKNEEERKQHYKEVFLSGDRRELIGLVKTIFFRREALKETGKKLRAEDERTLREAEKLLCEEFAYALKIDADQVLPFITGQAECGGKPRKDEKRA